MGSQRVGPDWATNTWAIWEIYLIFLNSFHVNRRYTCYKICMCFSLINLFWCTYILCLSQESRKLKEKLFLLPYKGFFLSEWVKVSQLCLTLCDPVDYTVHGILQARILEWVAFPFSKGSSQPRDQTQVSCIAGRFFTNWTIREAL